jgi:hypothetical protein
MGVFQRDEGMALFRTFRGKADVLQQQQQILAGIQSVT